MKTCPNCGNQVADEALFCNNCGTNVANVEASADASKIASETISAAAAGAANAAGAVGVAGTTGAAGGAFSGNTNAQPQNFNEQPQNFNGGQQSYQQFSAYDPSDHTAEFDPRDIADNKLFAVMPYFTFIFGVIIALLCKESAFTKFHAKNAIRLEIASILAIIPAIIPVLGWLVTGILMLIILILHIIAIVNCLQGKAKDLPIIGNIGFLK